MSEEKLRELTRKNADFEKQLQEMKLLLGQRMDIVPVPVHEKFSFKNIEWEFWIAGYERYRKASNINLLTQEQQINQFLLSMGNEVDKIFSSQNVKVKDFRTYEDIKNFFNLFYAKKINIIYERAKFNTQNQKDGETAEEYISAIITLSKACKYGALNDELIRDRLASRITVYRRGCSLTKT